MNRRDFLKLTGAGAGSAVTAPWLAAAEALPPGGNSLQEPARTLPFAGEADVIVCGAGPAGVSAAIAAARAGAKVRLFEWRGCLGGVWTAGLLGYLLDFDKPGFAHELARKLAERELRRGTSRKSMVYDPEGMKLLLEDLCGEAGVQFQLHTHVTAAYRTGRRLTSIVTESKSGRQAWRAPVFIDTTGDGDLGALAGCAWEFGEAKDCPCQPMSLDALLVVRDAAALDRFILASDPADRRRVGEARDNLRAEIERAGLSPSYGKPTFYQVRDNLLLAMLNHEYSVRPFDAAQVTAATVRARRELNQIVNALRRLGGPWTGLQLVATAEQIGVRDGRRLAGRYTVTQDDVTGAARHADAVTRSTFAVDVHAVTAQHNEKAAFSDAGVRMRAFDIPLRALIARDVDGLMMAGRCISGDFIAHASYRVTGNAVAMGEAAGAVAALAAQQARLPHEISWNEAAALLGKIRPPA